MPLQPPFLQLATSTPPMRTERIFTFQNPSLGIATGAQDSGPINRSELWPPTASSLCSPCSPSLKKKAKASALLRIRSCRETRKKTELAGQCQAVESQAEYTIKLEGFKGLCRHLNSHDHVHGCANFVFVGCVRTWEAEADLLLCCCLGLCGDSQAHRVVHKLTCHSASAITNCRLVAQFIIGNFRAISVYCRCLLRVCDVVALVGLASIAVAALRRQQDVPRSCIEHNRKLLMSRTAHRDFARVCCLERYHFALLQHWDCLTVEGEQVRSRSFHSLRRNLLWLRRAGASQASAAPSNVRGTGTRNCRQDEGEVEGHWF